MSMAFKYEPASPILAPLFDPDRHRYEWNGWSLPSVSHVLSETGIKEPFDRTFWQRSLMRKGMTEEESIIEMDRVRDESFARGTAIHLGIEHRLKGLPDYTGEDVGLEADLKSNMPHWEEFAAEHELSKVLMLEQSLIQPVGHYCGTVDCVAETKDGLQVIDWKTVKTIKKAKKQSWQLYQMAAYAGAINRTFDVRVTQAMNVYVGPDGWMAASYEPDELLNAWTQLQGLLKDYWEIRTGVVDYHSPDMAAAAFKAITEQWGPWEKQ